MITQLFIELEHEDFADSVELASFHDDVLMNTEEGAELILHSNFLGDEIGIVRVIKINPKGWV